MGKAHTIKSENVARDLLRKLGPVPAKPAVAAARDVPRDLLRRLGPIEKASGGEAEKIAHNLLRRLGPAPDIREVVPETSGSAGDLPQV